MKHALNVLASILAGLASSYFIFSDTNDVVFSVAGGTIAFVVFLVVFYGEKKLFPEWKGDLLFCIGVGALVGVILSFLVVKLFVTDGSRGIPVLVTLILGLLGSRAGVAFYKHPGLAIFGGGAKDLTFAEGAIEDVRDKILDTSVVIDGRILDIADTHFIDGPLILPNFVLREIQLISDSSDPIKRARGRRGLDMLNKLQRKGSIEVKITYADYSDTREVDAKLIKLAIDTGGKIVTNDFNLNKVAELQGVKVLNLNNLANALKPVVLPGEELNISVIKEGKDENQGIGYLEDGTMVVIENGGYLVGKEVKVVVTSIIQTNAGKMIFTKVNK
ncbi:PIN/TRAM domain-containing protein [Leptospira sp. GIMC2001]|uniref:PIN/TRAM domain-containing protein n=1 Tax=Leptospira sp. GIMC2001 TaxID=1513297 RepID=UPI00234B6FC7|nr:PIN domain-containing protein [Leptospira sp. GIMC2001]WCL50349.1 TRAM domain-containing protein [Leptospira sp. GIMC2001]